MPDPTTKVNIARCNTPCQHEGAGQFACGGTGYLSMYSNSLPEKAPIPQTVDQDGSTMDLLGCYPIGSNTPLKYGSRLKWTTNEVKIYVLFSVCV